MNTSMQPTFARGYPQATQRSPAATRRGAPSTGSGPSPQLLRPTLTPSLRSAMSISLPPQNMPNPHLMAAQRNMTQPNDTALRRSRKPTDKNIPDGVEGVVIGEGVQQYKRLRDLEKRLDAAMFQKKLNIQDSLARKMKRYRTLRIWISNTVENQPWQRVLERSEGQGGTIPGSGCYRLKIEGRLLDENNPMVPNDSDDEEEVDFTSSHEIGQDRLEGTKPRRATPRYPLSQFFKSIIIDFDKTPVAKPEDIAPITWNKPQLPSNAASLPPNADFDCIQFSRASQENLNIIVSLVRDESTERFKLSKELADVLDVEEESRSGIVLGIWDYINAMGLQEDEEKRQVRCDQRLKAVFGRDQMFFPQIPEIIGPQTTPLDPIKLPYTIRVDPEFHKDPSPTVYDICVIVDDPLRRKMSMLTSNPQYPASIRQISLLDDQLSLVIQALLHSKARHSFYTGLSKDPATFIRRWLSSQRRDLETILGEATHGGGEDGSGPEFRRGGTNGAWDTPVAREAVRYMLAKPDGR